MNFDRTLDEVMADKGSRDRVLACKFVPLLIRAAERIGGAQYRAADGSYGLVGDIADMASGAVPLRVENFV